MDDGREDGACDKGIAFAVQSNMSQQYLYAPITQRVTTRVAQTHGGQQLSEQLNQNGPANINIDVQADKDEAILLGSIKFVARVRLEARADADNALLNWSNRNGGQNDERFTLVNNQQGDVRIELPPLVMAAQFNTIDLELADVQSINAHLPMTRQSEEGCVPQALMDMYYNQTRSCNIYMPNTTACPDIEHRVSLGALQHTDIIDFQERVYHQLFVPYNHLMSNDLEDYEVRKALPRGMGVRIRTTTRPADARQILARNHQNTHTMRIVFVDCSVQYQVLQVSEDHAQAEPETSTYPTIDIATRVMGLYAGLTRIVVPISYTDASVIPYMICVTVVSDTCFNAERLAATHSVISVVPGRLRTVRASLNGNQNPDFMAIYPDYSIDMRNTIKKTDMYQAFQGRIGSMPGKAIANLSHAEAEVLGFTERANVQVTSSAIIITDPSAFCVRQACSGVTAGRLDLHCELAGVVAGERLLVTLISKQHISFTKQSESPGAPPQYVLNTEDTVPAFVQYGD